MKITNRLNLPQAIVDAVRNDGYSRGTADISVTQLLGPPRQVALIQKHEHQLEEDASDRIFSLLGQAVHTILERANREGIAERRLTIKVEGWTISGGMDAYFEHGMLADYKISTVYKFKGGVAPPEWEAQLNVYAEMLRQNGDKVGELFIVGILRDWSKLEAARDRDYPQHQVVTVPVPLWSPEKAQKYIRERVILHQQARVELPLCTMEERWGKPDTFAVMKQGGKRALRVYTSEIEAHDHAASDSALYVSKRPGESTRCKAYCPVAKFCTQYRAIQDSSEREWLGEEVSIGVSNRTKTG